MGGLKWSTFNNSSWIINIIRACAYLISQAKESKHWGNRRQTPMGHVKNNLLRGRVGAWAQSIMGGEELNKTALVS